MVFFFSPVHVESSTSNAEISPTDVESSPSRCNESNCTQVDDFNSVGCYISGYIKQLVCQTCELIEWVKNNSNSTCVIKFT